MTKLAMAQELVKMRKDNTNNRKYSRGGTLVRKYGEADGKLSLLEKDALFETDPEYLLAVDPEFYMNKLGGQEDKDSTPNYSTFTRELPLWIQGGRAFSDMMGWTNKVDYSNSNMIRAARNRLSPIATPQIFGSLRYQPVDISDDIDRAMALAGTTRRALYDNAGANRAAANAAQIVQDYNTINAIGNMASAARQEEYNRRKEYAKYYDDIASANATLSMTAATTNQRLQELGLNAALQEAALRDVAETQAAKAREGTLNTFLENLQSLGIENQNKNMVQALIDSGWAPPLSSGMKRIQAEGGKLNKKRKGGLTF